MSIIVYVYVYKLLFAFSGFFPL